MSTASDTRRWTSAFESSRQGLPRVGWLTTLRDAAMARFRETGFPSRRDEDWRYTDLRPVVRTPFAAAPPPEGPVLETAVEALERLGPPQAEAARLVFVNGRLAPSLSQAASGRDGVVARGLAEVLSGNGVALRERLGHLARGEESALQALNTALWADGAFVHLASGARVRPPVHLVFLALGTGEPTFVSPRVLVVAEAGSEGRLVETWTGAGPAPCFHNAVAEVWVEENASLELLEMQHQATEALHFRALHVHQAADSRFGSTCVSVGSRMARHDVRVHLDAPGAECRLDGLSLVRGEQRVDHQTRIVHAKPHGSSRQLYKGVLDERSRVAFSGRVVVEHDAQKTDARQANHNVLLSRDAVADSKPQLEIFADDVKCAHGATVGRLDEETLFYLRSRGLSPVAAQAMLLRAFAAEVPTRIVHPDLRHQAEEALERFLPAGER